MENNLRELAQLVTDAFQGGPVLPVFYSGAALGGDVNYLYIGYVSACEEGDVALTCSGGFEATAAPGVIQTFRSAAGSGFDFVGYRIYAPVV